MMVVSSNVTVKLKFFVLSAAVELTTVLVTVRSPVFLVLVNSAVTAASPMEPVSPVFVVVKLVFSVSATV